MTGEATPESGSIEDTAQRVSALDVPEEPPTPEDTAPADEAPPEAPAEPTPSDEEAEPWALAQLAEAAGMEPAALYQLEVPATNAVGESIKVKLGSLKDGCQKYEKAQALRAEAEHHRNESLAARAQVEQLAASLSRQAAEADSLIQLLASDYRGRFAEVNWDSLKAEDPERFLKLQRDMDRSETALKEAKARSQELWQNAQAAHMQHASQVQSAALEHEKAKLIEFNGEWADPKRGRELKQGVSDYVATLHYFQDFETKKLLQKFSENLFLVW